MEEAWELAVVSGFRLSLKLTRFKPIFKVPIMGLCVAIIIAFFDFLIQTKRDSPNFLLRLDEGQLYVKSGTSGQMLIQANLYLPGKKDVFITLYPGKSIPVTDLTASLTKTLSLHNSRHDNDKLYIPIALHIQYQHYGEELNDYASYKMHVNNPKQDFSNACWKYECLTVGPVKHYKKLDGLKSSIEFYNTLWSVGLS